MKVRRLDFRMPPFSRLCWVSGPAQARWKPTLQTLQRRTEELAWRSVAVGLRTAAVLSPGPGGAAPLRTAVTEAGLAMRHLPLRPSLAPQHRNPVIIGRKADWMAPIRAWEEGDVSALLRHLGVPSCCSKAIRRWRRDGWYDLTWPSMSDDDVKAPAPGSLNRLLVPLGVAALPFDPCGSRCSAALGVASDNLALGRTLWGKDMNTLEAVLDWPMDWSALHGIAELRTPVFKHVSDTDSTAERLERRRLGRGTPQEVGRGLGFPYIPPARLKVTGTHQWRRGLDNPLHDKETP